MNSSISKINGLTQKTFHMSFRKFCKLKQQLMPMEVKINKVNTPMFTFKTMIKPIHQKLNYKEVTHFTH